MQNQYTIKSIGTDAIYQCKRGKRIHHLEQISDELEAYFDENPPKDVPDAVRKNQRKFWNSYYNYASSILA